MARTRRRRSKSCAGWPTVDSVPTESAVTETAAGKAFPVVHLAVAAIFGAVIGLAAWGWMAFGDTIYLTRLAAVVASCF